MSAPLGPTPGVNPAEITPLPHPAFLGPFILWLMRNGVTDLDAPDSYYDYRGAFLAGLNRGPDGHWPDTFKQHGHPTFSIESQYSAGPDDGGRWEGDTFIPPRPKVTKKNRTR